MGNGKAKGVEIIMNLDLARRIRKRIKESGSLGSYAEIGKALLPEFPEFAPGTLKDHAIVLGTVSDYLFGLYEKGDLSWYALMEFGHTELDSATMDFLGKEFIDRGMNVVELKKVKAYLRDRKHRYSVAEALGRATGEISANTKSKELKEVTQSFESILEKFSKKVTEAVAYGDMVMDLMPMSALDKGKIYYDYFEKAYMARHSAKRLYEFLDKRTKMFLDQLAKFARVETEILRNKEDQHGGSHQDQGREVPEAPEVLGDAPGQSEGEGRVGS